MKFRRVKKAMATGMLAVMMTSAVLPSTALAGTLPVGGAALSGTALEEGFHIEAGTGTVYKGYEVTGNILIMTNFPGQTGNGKCSEYKVGSTFYTYNAKGTSKTTGYSSNMMYVKVGSKYKYVAGAQCLAYARYIQEKLYGVNDGANAGKFKSVGSLSASKMNASRLKALIQKGGRGAHLRTGGKHHSFIVLKATDTYFTVVDANGTAGTSKIGKKTFTYEDYAKSGWGKRGIDYLNVKK